MRDRLIKFAGESDRDVLYTYVAPDAVDDVLVNGLHGGKALLTHPKQLSRAAQSRGQSNEEFAAQIKERLRSKFHHASRGPSAVFHQIPANQPLSPKHPVKRHKLEAVAINLGLLLHDKPDTKLYGLELHPHATSGNHLRHRYMRMHEVEDLKDKTPEQYWSTYNDIENKGQYAPDVPHVAIHTASGSVDGKYLSRVAKEKKAALLKMAVHSRSTCMHCDAPVTTECRWCEGRARAWFCDKHMKEFEGKEQIQAKRKVSGVVGAKYGESPKMEKTALDAGTRQLVASLEGILQKRVSLAGPTRARTQGAFMEGLVEQASKQAPQEAEHLKALHSNYTEHNLAAGTEAQRQQHILGELHQFREGGQRHWGASRKDDRSPFREAIEREYARMHASGAHLPKSNETLLPGTISGEFVQNAERERTPLLFRGTQPTTSNFLATRHPDVAAAYATGRVVQQWTGADNVLLALRRKKLHSIGEGAADTVLRGFLSGGEHGSLDKAYRQKKALESVDHSFAPWVERLKAKDRAQLIKKPWRGPSGTPARNTRTYEDLVSAQPGAEVGRYRVRPSRIPSGPDKGLPAYAVSDISGVPAKSIFS